MKRFMNKKVAAIGLTAGLALGAAGAAFAYFTTTGSGSGTGSVGSSSNVTINQTGITYNGPGGTGVDFLPGDTASVTWSATNNGGNQQVGTVSLSNWSSNMAGCDPTDLPGAFTMVPVTENQNVPNGTTALTNGGTITFNDLNTNENACEGATITFDYSS